ncbi:MAG: NADPH-dependent oxidoreductase, partial [Alphaproteobacteria bacterium]
GAGPLPAPGPWNAVIAGLLAHRSVRRYRPDPVPEGTCETLIAAAQSAATSSNLQAWSVISVTDPALRDALARAAGDQDHVRRCPLFLVWCADLSRHAAIAAEAGRELPALDHLEAFLVAAIDAALAAQNAVVAAESLGLGTVYIGGIRNRPETVARLLDLPPRAAALFGLCVGWPDLAAGGRVRPRLPQGAVHFVNRHGRIPDPALLARHKRAAAAFAAAEGLAEPIWTRRMLDRLGSIAAMHGRHALKASLRRLGFPLR